MFPKYSMGVMCLPQATILELTAKGMHQINQNQDGILNEKQYQHDIPNEKRYVKEIKWAWRTTFKTLQDVLL